MLIPVRFEDSMDATREPRKANLGAQMKKCGHAKKDGGVLEAVRPAQSFTWKGLLEMP